MSATIHSISILNHAIHSDNIKALRLFLRQIDKEQPVLNHRNGVYDLYKILTENALNLVLQLKKDGFIKVLIECIEDSSIDESARPATQERKYTLTERVLPTSDNTTAQTTEKYLHQWLTVLHNQLRHTNNHHVWLTLMFKTNLIHENTEKTKILLLKY